MTTKRRYTKREKATAVIAAELTSNLAVERATGIPNQTVGRWRDDPAMRIFVEKTRDEMAEEMRGLAAMALDHIRKRLHEFEPRELVTLLGVSTEKALLLAGDATSRTETRDITGTLTDADVIDALRSAEQATGARRTPSPDPAEAAG